MWLFKGDNGKYLHSFRVGFYGRVEELKWDEAQIFAWRFHDRNAASSIGAATGVPGTIISLTPGGFSKRLAAIEAANREVKKELAVAVEMLRTGLLPSEGSKP